ncbi:MULTISPECIES: sodium:solute symporter family protein [Streptomyces]|uniref:Sodium:solute symporter family protein n=1 Tax=Streptomyces sp. NBC_00119 TaxID=2975659 RepID=A0AAU1UD94_9ACTN|nr:MULTISPECIES: sodium:solute symporter family protein [unclassified Streptomyces]MCX4644924.1 sodium:solute symporter family protein [Streptomyces sp. NBC_01446]MCX5326421.1 sodium:solute symporter family protein [Streptomyces sp. NBC_00120]MCX5437860.1 sodium:solute symporter family protein [Streptomyces sp. NBC_00063]WSD97783.1 sodium:solute symporter family protein [Streptomyces sp. NBC_01474]WUB95559.1 sodium:solute symporter family protein [Streptomyces sp. NBC_00569]
MLSPTQTLAAGLRLPTNGLDYAILAIYFAVVLGIGFAARRSVKTSLDFFLSGRSLPAWVTGLAFVAANLGATEILGMAATGAQYGVSVVHWYWIGAIPAMVFLGLVMMPFYYRSKVRSVPEYLLQRFDKSAHLLSSILFAFAAILIAGVNLYALSIVVEALLGWPQWLAIVVAGLFVLAYITIGGLSSAIYNEVLQFFVILAALIPLCIIGLKRVGGWGGMTDSLKSAHGDNFLSAWGGTGIGEANPLGANWLTIILGLGFVLSFGYWTTNFAEVQRALSAKNLSAAQRTPLIAAFPKIFIVFLVMIPGMVAAVLVPKIGMAGSGLTYNDAIPYLMQELLPNGVLGIAVTGLLAAFMAGMAANVSSFNTVFTYDIWAKYVKTGKPDAYYLKFGRLITAVGVLASIGTAFIASSFSNIMGYLQTLFSFFNVPMFVVFIIGMFWKRASVKSGVWGLLAGTTAAMVNYFWIYKQGVIDIPTDQGANFVSAIVGFVAGAVVMVVVTLFTAPKPEAELAGLVYGTTAPGLEEPPAEGDDAWYRKPALLGWGAIVLAALCYVPFSL